MTDYEEFLESKSRLSESVGIDVDKEDLNPNLFEFQKDIVKWALKKGKTAIFADCGLGKTIMQLEWLNQIHKQINKPVLILAPLAVSEQTKNEGLKFGIDVNIISSPKDVINGINITNYEKLEKFDTSLFSAIVLDESSILKSYQSKTRAKLIELFRDTPFKLCCTATPAPNDYMELANHCEFLNIMSRYEMLSTFFTHDGSNTSAWNLKGHGKKKFWEWLASWAVVVSNPRDLDYFEVGFDLPELKMDQVMVNGNFPNLKPTTLSDRRKYRRESIEVRCEKAAEIANSSDEQFLIWCDLNKESELITKAIDDAKEIKGQTKEEDRIKILNDFINGDLRVLVTKPSIAGFGMNLQNCHNMIFVGLSDSYEKFYQAVRRCWRFGQENKVNAYIVISALEGVVIENIRRKDKDSETMKQEMLNYTRDSVINNLTETKTIKTEYQPNKRMELPSWM